MTAPPGRRERKKAATRQKIADTALRLFLERGYDPVGIRDVAAEADVAVTTVFSHFASKEALVFAQDENFEHRLVQAVTVEPLIPALRHEISAMVRHCAARDRVPLRRMIGSSPALRDYENAMLLRYAESLATAITAEVDRSPTACRAIARFVIDAYAIARDATEPEAALEETFRMIEAAWDALDFG
ncbi:TetR/AcrR family transcriptional regulator [Amycolatopsis sp. OK19-0408]|uniref:TetR/AcrR family transcriptional regulator n=1 Tax=Amycolatopsis iheyensis TaxID=2945988 RepID=A0A9X2SMG3_9PSEU|nr:TetR/AcrR family transcriptional regulator [Amycolatopsis iheyensis]MCR6487807.1 TetR/AcrR family transcriptional regulator [Amycolatopsis iheyensis]